MTRFGPSAEQREWISTIERACIRAGLPGVLTRDDALAAVAPEMDRLAGELGITGLAVPEPLGGSGGSFVDLYLTTLTFGRFAAPTWPIMRSLAAWSLGTLASESAGASDLLDQLLAEDVRVAVATVSDGALQPVGSDRISGTIPEFALDGEPDAVLVTDSQLVVWADLANADVQSLGRLDLVREYGSVSLRDCPARILARGPGAGARIRAAALTVTAADAVGGSGACLEQVLAYVSERRQFGRPIAEFQAVQHQIADLTVLARPVRSMALGAAYLVDEPGADGADVFRLAAMAKNQSVESFVAVTRRAVELHGAYGFTWECPVNLFLRRALVDRVLGGTPDSLRDEIAGRDPVAAVSSGDWPYPFNLGL